MGWVVGGGGGGGKEEGEHICRSLWYCKCKHKGKTQMLFTQLCDQRVTFIKFVLP